MQKILFFIICITNRSDKRTVAFFIKRIKKRVNQKRNEMLFGGDKRRLRN